MTESFFVAHPFVTVAVAFDEHTPGLVRRGIELAGRHAKGLYLLHVVDATFAGQSEAMNRAYVALDVLAQTVPAGMNTRVGVAMGEVAGTLAEQAAEIGTCVLLVGAKERESGLIKRGMAVAADVVAKASVPVMVIDATETRGAAPMGAHPRFLLADDLTDKAETAVAFTAGLAEGVHDAWIHHVHISALSRENLNTALNSAAAAAHAELAPGLTADVCSAVAHEQVLRLEERIGEYRDYLEAAGCKYSAEALAGPLRGELDKIIADFNPDVLVFGRHRAPHLHPLTIGQLPLKAMLGFGRPVVVVPDL